LGYHKKATKILASGRKALNNRSQRGKEGLKKRARKLLGGR